MHARVTVSQIQPSKLEQGVSIMRDSVVPAIEQQKGFKGLLALTDPRTAKAITISLWETEEDMKAAEDPRNYYHKFFPGVAHIIPGLNVPEIYEVTAQV